jgi:transcriptional regulator with XRE-family HTH domain
MFKIQAPYMNETVKQQFLKDFGTNLKKLRQQNNITQAEFAYRCGGTTDTKKIGRTERGEYDFRLSSLLVLARGLDVEVSKLLYFTFPKELGRNLWENDCDA